MLGYCEKYDIVGWSLLYIYTDGSRTGRMVLEYFINRSRNRLKFRTRQEHIYKWKFCLFYLYLFYTMSLTMEKYLSPLMFDKDYHNLSLVV